jgi:D-alanyl-lipoteichoic acid acyltransferase DltB (MBOAT superfamily)
MSITSLSFALFLLISIVLFYICPVKHRWKVLLAASIVFYAICGVKYLPFILFTSISVWWGGRRIGYIYQEQDAYVSNCPDRKKKKEIKAFCRQQAKRVLMLVMIVNLAVLCAVKFLKYAIPPLNSLLAMGGAEGGLTAEMIIVPLGISYYTFSTVGYLLDVTGGDMSMKKAFPASCCTPSISPTLFKALSPATTPWVRS